MRALLIATSVVVLIGCSGSGQLGSTGGASTTGASGSASTGSSSGSTGTGSGGTTTGSSGSTASSGTSGATTASSGSTGSSGTSGRWVMGYYPGYQRSMLPPSQVDFADLTHLAIGPVIPQTDGSLDTQLDIDPVNGPALLHDLIARAHAANVKAVVMLGGAGEQGNWQGAASDSNRATLIANLIALQQDAGFDGYDFDWEPVDASDQAPLQATIENLRAAKPGLVLTMPIGWVSSNAPNVDGWYGTIAADLDQMNVMTYDMADAWGGWDSWFSAALQDEASTHPSSVASSIDAYLAAGVPAAKLGVGVGFYGSCWGGVDGPRQPTSGPGVLASDNVMTYPHIMSAYFEPSAYHYDSAADAPWLGFSSPTGPEGCTFVSYEDPTSIAAKGAFAKSRGLGGAIIWTINQDDPGSATLLQATGQAFLR